MATTTTTTTTKSPDNFFWCKSCGEEATEQWRDPDLKGYCLKCVREGLQGKRQLRRPT